MARVNFMNFFFYFGKKKINLNFMMIDTTSNVLSQGLREGRGYPDILAPSDLLLLISPTIG